MSEQKNLEILNFILSNKEIESHTKVLEDAFNKDPDKFINIVDDYLMKRVEISSLSTNTANGQTYIYTAAAFSREKYNSMYTYLKYVNQGILATIDLASIQVESFLKVLNNKDPFAMNIKSAIDKIQSIVCLNKISLSENDDYYKLEYQFGDILFGLTRKFGYIIGHIITICTIPSGTFESLYFMLNRIDKDSAELNNAILREQKNLDLPEYRTRLMSINAFPQEDNFNDAIKKYSAALNTFSSITLSYRNLMRRIGNNAKIKEIFAEPNFMENYKKNFLNNRCMYHIRGANPVYSAIKSFRVGFKTEANNWIDRY